MLKSKLCAVVNDHIKCKAMQKQVQNTCGLMKMKKSTHIAKKHVFHFLVKDAKLYFILVVLQKSEYV